MMDVCLTEQSSSVSHMDKSAELGAVAGGVDMGHYSEVLLLSPYIS